MRCQTGYALGVGSVHGGGWHGLGMVALSPHMFFPKSNCGRPRSLPGGRGLLFLFQGGLHRG